MSCNRVFNHSNYLDFLKSEMSLLKASDPEWSVSKWARAMNFSNVVGLHMIIKGTRRPGGKSLPHFVKFFNFTEKEENYFKFLIKKDLMSKDQDTLNYIDTKLKVLSFEDKAKFLDLTQFSFISEWYHFAIQQMITRSPVPANAAQIKTKLKYEVTVGQVENALQNLLKLQVIELKGDHYHAVEHSIRTPFDIPSEALKTHHEQMIKNASTAIRTVPVTERQIHGRTLVIKKEDLNRAAEMIREFSDQFGVAMDKPQGDQVYQLNIQFVPLTEELGSYEQ